MPADSTERLLFLSFVVASLFAVLTFVLASFRLPLYSALVAGGISFLVLYFLVYCGLWLSGYGEDR
jgi:hypothetical protein